MTKVLQLKSSKLASVSAPMRLSSPGRTKPPVTKTVVLGSFASSIATKILWCQNHQTQIPAAYRFRDGQDGTPAVKDDRFIRLEQCHSGFGKPERFRHKIAPSIHS